jgi:hypothetical protein
MGIFSLFLDEYLCEFVEHLYYSGIQVIHSPQLFANSWGKSETRNTKSEINLNGKKNKKQLQPYNQQPHQLLSITFLNFI